MEDLESHLLASRRVRDFLKCFSSTQWPRVVKATLMLGIQVLERQSARPAMSAKDIEELVGKPHRRLSGLVANEEAPAHVFERKRGAVLRNESAQTDRDMYINTDESQPNIVVHKVAMTSPGLSEPNYKFRNEFKQQSEPRPAKQAKPRRDRE